MNIIGLGGINKRIDDENFDSLEDAIANREFGMDYKQLGKNEKEWVRDEMDIIGLGGIGSKTSAVYTDPKTGKKYSLQYVSYKKKWELDIIKKGASIYSSNAIVTIKRDTIKEIRDWLDGYNINSKWTKGIKKE